jgi:hypothetical protein
MGCLCILILRQASDRLETAEQGNSCRCVACRLSPVSMLLWSDAVFFFLLLRPVPEILRIN